MIGWQILVVEFQTKVPIDFENPDKPCRDDAKMTAIQYHHPTHCHHQPSLGKSD